MFSEIYIDESSQTKHRYLLLGGIILPEEARDSFERCLWAARTPELPAMEIGWVKVSRAKLVAYKRFVDVFFDNPEAVPGLDFHSLVVDTTKINNRAFNNGSKEIGFNKEVYQLCDKFARLYPDRLFHVYPDHRSTKSNPDELRLILNRGRAKKGDRRDWPFRRIHFRHSDEWQVLQLVDLLLGAIAYRLNGHYDAEDASPAKRALCDHILGRADVKDVGRDTSRSGRVTIWHRVLR